MGDAGISVIAFIALVRFVRSAAANLLLTGSIPAVLPLRWDCIAHAGWQIMLAPGDGQLKTGA